MKKIVFAILIALFTYSLAYAIKVEIVYPKQCATYETLKTYGKIKTTQDIKIFSPISGIIKINYNFRTIKKGQLIAQIYPQNLSKEIRYAKANEMAAYNNLQNTLILQNSHIATIQDVEKAKMLYYQSKNNLEGFNAQLKQSKIYAPFSGSLEYIVPDKSLLTLNQPIAVLTGSGNLWIKAYIVSTYINKLKVGEPAYYYVDNHKNKGLIAQITHTADNSGLVPIFINVNNTNLIAGQWVSLKIPIAKRISFCVPKSAIVSKGSKTYIYFIDHNVAYAREVNLVNISGQTAYIVGHIDETQPIAITATERLTNNTKVEIIK